MNNNFYAMLQTSKDFVECSVENITEMYKSNSEEMEMKWEDFLKTVDSRFLNLMSEKGLFLQWESLNRSKWNIRSGLGLRFQARIYFDNKYGYVACLKVTQILP